MHAKVAKDHALDEFLLDLEVNVERCRSDPRGAVEACVAEDTRRH